MKIVEINGNNYASVGNIMLNIAKNARNQGFEVFTCCKNSRKSQEFHYDNQIYIGTRLERVISEYLANITGYSGSFNYIGTKLFINKLKKIKPDLIHLHVMHDTYINLSMLFKYIKDNNIPVVWTFHDCWPFTGKCPHFEARVCYKWEKGCYNCPQIKNYPQSFFFDRSKYLWNKKKELFTSIDNLTVVTPSMWLKNYVEKSFFNKYRVDVINNGINLDIFKPIESDFRDKNNLNDKYIILGVGYNWTKYKGLNTFIELSSRLSSKYQIVLVGTNDEIDKLLPSNIISIHRTYNQEELAKLYSTADLFVNPTLVDNFPTVNIEALACGTPVLTYNTGGSPEIIDETCGDVVEKSDIDALLKQIENICENHKYNKEACLTRASKFDMNDKFNDYVDLYKEILG